MKYIFLLIATITMAANIIITLQVIRLKKKIGMINAPSHKEEIIFHLPKKGGQQGKACTSDICDETIIL